jgi:malate dehydrogenase (oxaloacetate-decarboxylating)(NADP+)
MVFAEGEEEKSIRAAIAFQSAGYGTAVLIGREDRIRETMRNIGFSGEEKLEIHNAKMSRQNKRYTDILYKRLQRRGFLYRDAQRLVNQERNIFGSLMVQCGDADAMVTGLTRNPHHSLDQITMVLDPKPDKVLFGLTVMLSRGRTIFIADSMVNEIPSAIQLAEICVETARKVRQLGHVPRVALLSFSNFGNPPTSRAALEHGAISILDERKVDFEYDGEMAADVALDFELMRAHYPFCRLSGPANVLVMPGLCSANISSKLLQKLGGGTVIGPVLVGLSKPVQIVPMNATVSDIVNLALISAFDAIG